MSPYRAMELPPPPPRRPLLLRLLRVLRAIARLARRRPRPGPPWVISRAVPVSADDPLDRVGDLSLGLAALRDGGWGQRTRGPARPAHPAAGHLHETDSNIYLYDPARGWVPLYWA